MKIMEAWQRQRIATERDAIAGANTLDDLVEIGVPVFASNQDWYKDGLRGCYSDRLRELRRDASKLVLVVDAHNWIYADWNASKETDGAIELFFNRIQKLRENLNPNAIFAAFDSGTSFRNELEPLYKPKRSEVDPDLLRQKDEIRDRCFEEGVMSYSVDNYEADDVIASIAFRKPSWR